MSVDAKASGMAPPAEAPPIAPFRAEDVARMVSAAQGALAEDRTLQEYLRKALEDESTVAAFTRILDAHKFAPDDPIYLLLEHHRLMDTSIRRGVAHTQSLLQSHTTVAVEITRVMHGFAEVGAACLARVAGVCEWLEKFHGAMGKLQTTVERVQEPGGMARSTVVWLILGGGALAGLTGAGALYAVLHLRGVL